MQSLISEASPSNRLSQAVTFSSNKQGPRFACEMLPTFPQVRSAARPPHAAPSRQPWSSRTPSWQHRTLQSEKCQAFGSGAAVICVLTRICTYFNRYLLAVRFFNLLSPRPGCRLRSQRYQRFNGPHTQSLRESHPRQLHRGAPSQTCQFGAVSHATPLLGELGVPHQLLTTYYT